jgi:hypothetical protein
MLDVSQENTRCQFQFQWSLEVLLEEYLEVCLGLGGLVEEDQEVVVMVLVEGWNQLQRRQLLPRRFARTEIMELNTLLPLTIG